MPHINEILLYHHRKCYFLILSLLILVMPFRIMATFTEITSGFTGVLYSSLAFGDCDNDGDLDVLLAGCPTNTYTYTSKIYRNNSNASFTEITSGLPGVGYCSTAWGDYDNDGDLDILLTGGSANNPYSISKIYRNNGNNTFTDINAGLTAVTGSSSKWGDFDNDGDLDAIENGYTSGIYGADVQFFYYKNLEIEQ